MWWLIYDYHGKEQRESAAKALGLPRGQLVTDEAEAQRALAARLAQIAEPPAGSVLSPGERVLMRRTLEAVISLASSALTKLGDG